MDKVRIWRTHVVFWPLVAVGLGLDLLTKHLAFARLQMDEHIELIPGLLRINLALNSGGAFSLVPGRRWLLIAAGIAAMVAILVWLFLTKDHRMPVIMGLAAVLAGICGNLYDRIFNYGLVRDFIDLCVGRWHWPTFNIADSLLCIGVAIMLLYQWLTGRPSQRHGLPQR